LTRMSFQVQRRALALFALPTDRVLVVGAGRMGEAAVRYVLSGSDRRVRLVGFVDDDAFKAGKLVHGHQVLGSLEDLPRIHEATGFGRILIAAEQVRDDRMAMVKSFAERNRLVLQRFSIAVNEFTANSGNGALDAEPTLAPASSALVRGHSAA
jgi:FlaA1/EpsC-like NDP-sugar epimerase